jgi:hypothetical protein
MPEPLESEPTGVTLESDALPQEDFPPGDVRRRPEAPGNLHLGQAAAVPTYGLLQVDNGDPLFNSEFETGGGETLQTPAPSGPQTAPTATAVGVVGISLQHKLCNFFARGKALLTSPSPSILGSPRLASEQLCFSSQFIYFSGVDHM